MQFMTFAFEQPPPHTEFYGDPQCHHKCQKFTYPQCITFAELLNHLEKKVFAYIIPNNLNTQLSLKYAYPIHQKYSTVALHKHKTLKLKNDGNL